MDIVGPAPATKEETVRACESHSDSNSDSACNDRGRDKHARHFSRETKMIEMNQQCGGCGSVMQRTRAEGESRIRSGQLGLFVPCTSDIANHQFRTEIETYHVIQLHKPKKLQQLTRNIVASL